MSNAQAKCEYLDGIGDPWDVFDLNDETAESEPEYGDFWGEIDDDCDNNN